MQPAFGWIEGQIADVPKINVAKQRVGLTHALQGRNRGKPKNDSQDDPPARGQAERQTSRNHDRHEHQFPIAAQQQVGTVGGLVDTTSLGFSAASMC